MNARRSKDGLCEWFAYCTRPAVGTVSHPILGEVPCCRECAVHLDLNLKTTEPSRHGEVQDALEPLMDRELVERIRRGLDDETYRWVADPEVSGVYGLRVIETGEVVVIFYRNDSDFEVDALHFWGA